MDEAARQKLYDTFTKLDEELERATIQFDNRSGGRIVVSGRLLAEDIEAVLKIARAEWLEVNVDGLELWPRRSY